MWRSMIGLQVGARNGGTMLTQVISETTLDDALHPDPLVIEMIKNALDDLRGWPEDRSDDLP